MQNSRVAMPSPASRARVRSRARGSGACGSMRRASSGSAVVTVMFTVTVWRRSSSASSGRSRRINGDLVLIDRSSPAAPRSASSSDRVTPWRRSAGW